MASTAGRPQPSYTFVGREQELAQLHQAYEAACSGDGSLTMLVGEPGIGKTALCEQLAGLVGANGGRVLFGHCYEEVSLPYLAFVEALRDLLLSGEIDSLVTGPGMGTPYLARIVPELGERLKVDSVPEADPQEQRWRLLQVVTDLLRNASTERPLLLVLEDLHDADHGTLDLLLHLARNLQGSRLHVVGTYRDVAVDRTHPLSSALAELRRGRGFLQIPIRGLTVDELHTLYEAVRGQQVSREQAEAVHRSTEGNPLFVQEVLRYLVEAGIVVREGGRYVPQQGVGVGIPEGLRDVVGKRLSGLSETANRVLAPASVIGQDFRVDVLQMVAGLSEQEVLDALEEASERSIIEQRKAMGSLVFRFSHAFFRQVLYEEIFVARRIRWHQQVARALEQVHARRVEEHAAALAEHYSHSTDEQDLQKAIDYGLIAASRAMGVFAYSEAVGQLEQALNALEVLDPHDRGRRCDLLLSLTEALGPAGEPEKVETIAEEAFGLAEALSDSRRASRACQAALYGLLRRGANLEGRADLAFTPAWQRWAARADRYAEPDTRERVGADIAMGRGLYAAGDETKACEFYHRAMALARRLDDRQLIARAAIFLMAAEDVPARLHLAEEFWDAPGRGVSALTTVGLLGGCLMEFFAHGQRARVEELVDRLREHGERTREPQARVLHLVLQTSQAVIDGRFHLALELAEESRSASIALGFGIENDPRVGMAAQRALWYLGYAPRATPLEANPEILRRFPADTIDETTSHFLRYALFAGAAGRRALRLLSAESGGPISRSYVEGATSLLEAAVLTRAAPVLPLAVERARPVAELTPPTNLTCVARYLGAASAALGKPEEARKFYSQALQASERVRFRPEIALTRLQLAELLLSHYPKEHSEALAHLDFAIDEFVAMEMKPALARAATLRASLGKESKAPTYPDGLSEREVEVLRMLASGKRNQEIADELVISRNTVRHHVSNVFDKIGVANRAQAVAYARDKGLS